MVARAVDAVPAARVRVVRADPPADRGVQAVEAAGPRAPVVRPPAVEAALRRAGLAPGGPAVLVPVVPAVRVRVARLVRSVGPADRPAPVGAVRAVQGDREARQAVGPTVATSRGSSARPRSRSTTVLSWTPTSPVRSWTGTSRRS